MGHGVVGILVDVGQGERDLDAAKSTVAELYSGATVVVVPPEVVADPRSLKRAVEDAPVHRASVGPKKRLRDP